MELRPLLPPDRPRLAQLLARLPQFTPDEVRCALELVDVALSQPRQPDYRFCVAEAEGGLLGYVCYGPTPMTAATSDLYWIAVDRDVSSRGVGSALLAAAERDLRRRGARLLRVETSAQEAYGAARGFYEKHRFTEAARIPGFYAPGDDLVILTKSLA